MGDGEVAVEVVLGTKKFEKQYAKLESRLKNEELDLSVKTQNLDNLIEKLRAVQKEYDKTVAKSEALKKQLATKQSEYNIIDEKSKKGSISTEEWTKRSNLHSEITAMTIEQENLNAEAEKYKQKLAKIEGSLYRAEIAYNKQKNKIEETKKQIQDVKDAESEYVRKIQEEATAHEQAEQASKHEQTKQNLKDIGNKTESIIKKVARWGLAIFGVRSAYMFVRQAMSTLSQYDEKLGADIQYIRFALASMLKPIIEAIIKLVYKLLAYINYIAQAWFGVNLFANASAKAFEKVNSGVKDTNKSAKQLQKTLAGFDEMNILQDNGSVGTGGGGGGVTLPSQDLSDLSKIEIPEWVQWIADNKDYILGILKEIGIAIAVVFAVTTISKFSGAISSLGGVFGKVLGVIGGVITAIYGIVKGVEAAIKFAQDPTWENFTGILDGLAIAIAGVGIALVALNATNPVGWVALGVAGAIELVKWIGNLIDAQNDEIKTTISVKEADEQLVNAKKELKSATNNYKNAVENSKKAEKELTDLEKKHKISGKELYDQVMLGKLSFKDMNKEQQNVYLAYLNTIDAQNELSKATDELTKKTDAEREAEKQKSAAVYASEKTYEGYFKTLLDGYEKSEISANDMVRETLSVMEDMDKQTRQIFVDNLPDSVKKAFTKVRETTQGEKDLIWNFADGTQMSFKRIEGSSESLFTTISKKLGLVKGNMSELNKEFGTTLPNSIQKSTNKTSTLLDKLNAIKKLGNIGVSVGSSIAGSRNAKGAIYYPPKLAVGGIINQPGRGVPLAMGGERGAEGVIPLTDAQQMQRLGEAIGRYITVNASITNTMNGRVISRELKQIQNEEDFAFNGG